MIQLAFFTLIVRREALTRYPGGETAFRSRYVFNQVDDALISRVAMAVSDLQEAWDALETAGLEETHDYVALDIAGDQFAAQAAGKATRGSPAPWLVVDIDATGRAVGSVRLLKEA